MTENIGKVVGATGVIAEVEWLESPPRLYNKLVSLEDKKMMMVVFGSSSAKAVYCMVLTPQSRIYRGMKMVDTGDQLSVPVGEQALGRVINTFGQAVDGKKPIETNIYRPVMRSARVPEANVARVNDILETGIKPIDFFTPFLQGSKVALVGGAGIGKTVILTELINRLVVIAENKSAVFAAVGERSREALELHEDLRTAGVLHKISLIIGQMGENPAIRWHTAFASASVAEYLRDEMNNDVFFFMDNVFRFAQAGSEMSTIMHNIPSEDGYQPTLTSEMGVLNQRIASNKAGSITAFMALFVPSDDLTDAAVRSVFPYLDTAIVLSREVFQKGRFPAIDLLASSSATLSPEIVGNEHYRVYTAAKQTLEKADELERIVSLVGEAELSSADQLVYKRAQLIYSYMTQDLFLGQAGLAKKSDTIPRAEVVQSVMRILSGEFDKLGAEELMFIGSLSDLKKAESRSQVQAKTA
jgi:F-type H+/Na+-transporting ATPase subunit beta